MLSLFASITMQDLICSGRRDHLIDFVKDSKAGYDVGWFHREVCRKLEQFAADVAAGLSPRMIICAPPRHGKSFIVTERFPVWFMGHYPDKEIISCSYNMTAARARCAAAKKVASSELMAETFPGFSIAKDTRAKADWGLAHGLGSMVAAGVGTAITGKGADVLIIDDPTKGIAEAYSETIREKTWQWYLKDASTRLAPGAGILLMATRWHEEDLLGLVLDRHRHENWELLIYPAIATEDEEFRKKGEALHPSRYPLEVLESKRLSDPDAFNSLYQQNPTSDGGNIWKENWWKYYDVAPHRGALFQSWDLTFKSTGTSYVLGQVWKRWNGDLYLLEEIRGRFGFSDTLEVMKQTMNRYPRTQRLLIEDKANGPAIMDVLRKESWGSRIVPINPKGSKVARARAAEAAIRQGRVFLPNPENNPWVLDFLDECTKFPAGKFDDRVDCTSQAIQWSESNVNKRKKTHFIGHV